MSPYILEQVGSRLTKDNDSWPESKPPVLASIGTVLIDVFEASSPASSSASIPPPAQLPAGPPLSVPPLTPLSGLSSISHSNFTSTPQLDLSSSNAVHAEARQVLGGGALYALIGARIWLPPRALRTLIDRAEDGRDLPQHLERKLAEYGEGMWCFQTGEGRRMLTARIRYEGDVRLYQHLTPAPHRTLRSLLPTPLHRATYLHVAPPFSPQDLSELLDELASLASSGETWAPKIVFEPTPTSCHSGQREWLERVAPRVEVLSPNHEELLSLYSLDPYPPTSPDLKPTIERLIHHLLQVIGVGRDGAGAVVVRCGRLGCCVGTLASGIRWLPAFWDDEHASRVVDVTGAGNSFLGGYVAGLSLTGDPYQAALYGSVSASFVVQQIGLPLLGEQGRWNDDEPTARVEQLKKRVGM